MLLTALMDAETGQRGFPQAGEAVYIGSLASLESHFRNLARSMEEYGLPYCQSTYASDRAVDSRVVLVRSNDRFDHFGGRTCGVWVQVQHRTPDIALSNRDGWSVVAITEGQHSAYPLVLPKRSRSQQTYDNIGAKTSHVRAQPRESTDLVYRTGGDHGDGGVIEDAMLHLHHLHGSPIAASDLRGQLLREDGQQLAIRCANMTGKISFSTGLTALRSEQHQVGKLACR